MIIIPICITPPLLPTRVTDQRLKCISIVYVAHFYCTRGTGIKWERIELATMLGGVSFDSTLATATN